MLICRPSKMVQGTYSSLTLASGTASTSADYGLASLIDAINGAKYLWLTDSPVVAVRAVWDHGAPLRIDGARLGKHNLDVGLDVRIQRNATDVWTAPSQDAALTIAANHLDGHSATPWVDLRAVAGYTTTGYRYTSLYVPVNSVAPKLGGLVFMQEFEAIERQLQWGVKRGERRKYILSLETEAGLEQYYSRKLKQRYVRGQALPGDTEILTWVALHQESDGPVTPFILIVNEDVTVDGALLVRFSEATAEALEWAEDAPDAFPITLEFNEVSRGLPL